jgi:hypothetical protein
MASSSFCLQFEDEIFTIKTRKRFLFLLWFSCLDFDCDTDRQINQDEETRGNVFFQNTKHDFLTCERENMQRRQNT